jgi:hypothetical protein
MSSKTVVVKKLTITLGANSKEKLPGRTCGTGTIWRLTSSTFFETGVLLIDISPHT